MRRHLLRRRRIAVSAVPMRPVLISQDMDVVLVYLLRILAVQVLEMGTLLLNWGRVSRSLTGTTHNIQLSFQQLNSPSPPSLSLSLFFSISLPCFSSFFPLSFLFFISPSHHLSPSFLILLSPFLYPSFSLSFFVPLSHLLPLPPSLLTRGPAISVWSPRQTED